MFSGCRSNPTAHQRNEFMLFKGEVEHHFGENLLARANAFFVRQELRVNSPPFPGNRSSFRGDRIPEETRGGLTRRSTPGLARGFSHAGRIRFQGSMAALGWQLHFANFRRRRRRHVSDCSTRAPGICGLPRAGGQFFRRALLVTGGFRVDGNSEFGKEVSPAWSVAIPIQKSRPPCAAVTAKAFARRHSTNCSFQFSATRI